MGSDTFDENQVDAALSSDVDTIEENKVVDEKKQESERRPKSNNDGEKASFFDKVGSVYNDFRGEFKRITWPSVKDLQKKTITVVFTSLLFAIIIFCMDAIYDFVVAFCINKLG